MATPVDGAAAAATNAANQAIFSDVLATIEEWDQMLKEMRAELLSALLSSGQVCERARERASERAHDLVVRARPCTRAGCVTTARFNQSKRDARTRGARFQTVHSTTVLLNRLEDMLPDEDFECIKKRRYFVHKEVSQSPTSMRWSPFRSNLKCSVSHTCLLGPQHVSGARLTQT